jgi:hypothetical protein
MKTQFTDTHIQVERKNDIFDGPRQVVRREFDQGVVWFEKPIVAGENMKRISDRSKAKQLEDKFVAKNSGDGRQILNPQNL